MGSEGSSKGKAIFSELIVPRGAERRFKPCWEEAAPTACACHGDFQQQCTWAGMLFSVALRMLALSCDTCVRPSVALSCPSAPSPVSGQCQPSLLVMLCCARPMEWGGGGHGVQCLCSHCSASPSLIQHLFIFASHSLDKLLLPGVTAHDPTPTPAPSLFPGSCQAYARLF